YGNRDFSTTKGLTFKYDYRRTNHLEFQLNYTLQFAEGTGSDATTATGGYLQNLIAAGLPNLRFTTPLNYDSRHIITGIVDYRFRDNEGPTIGNSKIFENAGINLVMRARSGEPYTKYAQPIGNFVVAGVNGSRLPWHFLMDLKAEKNFDLVFGKKKEVSNGRPLSVNVFVLVRNLLNKRDVLGVYGYTSRPDDNGYITSPQGQQAMASFYSPQSYEDM